jgi:hypothetical protein
LTREPREQIPRPVRPPQATPQTPRSVSPQVRSEVLPQLQTPVRPTPSSPPAIPSRRADPDGPGRPEPSGRTVPAVPPAVTGAPPDARRAPIPGPEVYRERTPPPARPESREPPRVHVPPAPAPRAAMPAPPPRSATPQHPATQQRDVQRGREPDARVRMPEQQRGGQGREQMR